MFKSVEMMTQLEKMYSLSGLRVIITGTSGGLGLNQAVMLGRCGATVFALSRTGFPKDEGLYDIPDTVSFIKCDVGDEQQLKTTLTEIGDRGGVDVLVNNAGITKRKTVQDVTSDEWDAIHNVNVKALFNACRHAFPYLSISKHTGRVINIASMAAHFGFSEVVPYASSKSAVVGITRGLAVEWRNNNILVNAVSPGWFPSEMTKQVMDADRREKILRKIPLGRFGNPDELSAMICFLSSPAATYINGQDFCVDGGALVFGY